MKQGLERDMEYSNPWELASQRVLSTLKVLNEQEPDAVFTSPALVSALPYEWRQDPLYGTIYDTEIDKLLEPHVEAGLVKLINVYGEAPYPDDSDSWRRYNDMSPGYQANLRRKKSLEKAIGSQLEVPEKS